MLSRLILCPADGSDDTDGTCASLASSDSIGASDDKADDWRMYRRHLILGISVKDTCVTAMYRDVAETSKRKGKGGDGKDTSGRPTKKAKVDSSNGGASNDDASAVIASNATGTTNGIKDGDDKKDECNTKKPAGFTFLTPSRSREICNKVDARLSYNDGKADSRAASSYIYTYLRVPTYMPTLVVPSFTFIGSNEASSAHGDTVAGEKERKEYTQKKLPQQQSKKKQQQRQSTNVIPKSTKDAVSLKTPHGWQMIRPEQYCDAITSLTRSTKDTEVKAEGIVGLFDHLDVSSDHVKALMDGVDVSDGNGSGDSKVDEYRVTLRKQALKKLTVSLQKTNSWTSRIQASQRMKSPFWVPVNVLATQLPKHVMMGTPKQQSISLPHQESNLFTCSNVAIIGWDALPSSSKVERRRLLHNLIERVQSTTQQFSKQFLLLAVNDIQSILDAAREGVTIIGTDLARAWSRNGTALVLDLTTESNSGTSGSSGIGGGRIDLNDKSYARDAKPILPGCTCLACRPKPTSKRHPSYQHFVKCESANQSSIPSFTRAYIHHLFQAKEMLAESLLFVHNLHQLVVLLSRLSNAVIEDKNGDTLDAFCKKIERQL